MAEQLPEFTAESVGRPRWRGPGAWLALLALALLVYELTAQPAVSAVIGCAKFGWEDFRTARWLRSIDPDRRRGKTCFWFYVAAGVWKVTLTATIVMFVIAVVEALRQPNPQANQPIRPEILWTLLEAFVGFLLGCLITFVACCAALVRRVKVWVDSRVHWARRRNEWPPMGLQTNRAGRLVVAALFFPVTVLILGYAGLVAALLGGPARINPNLANLAGLVLMAPMALAGTAILLVRDILGRRIVASTPWECWPELIDDAAKVPEPAGPSDGAFA